MNLIIREGKTWPFEQEFDTLDAYRGYFLSNAAFVVRTIEDSSSGAILPVKSLVVSISNTISQDGALIPTQWGIYYSAPIPKRGGGNHHGQIFLENGAGSGLQKLLF